MADFSELSLCSFRPRFHERIAAGSHHVRFVRYYRGAEKVSLIFVSGSNFAVAVFGV